MDAWVILVALAGAGCGLGLLLVVAGLRGVPVLPGPNGLSAPSGPESAWSSPEGEDGSGPSRGRVAGVGTLGGGPLRTWIVGAGLGFLVWLLTGWPILALMATVAVGLGAKVFGAKGERNEWIAKTQAIATWTEMLRDTMAAADGVEEAIEATVPIAPEAIRREVAMLDARRRSEQPLSEALAAFGAEVDHPSCDLVVASLSAAAQGEGSDFVAVLSRLSTMTRDEVRMRLRVESSRAKLHTSSRIILGIVGLAMLVLVLIGRDFLEPYSTFTGQLVLLLAGGLLTGGMAMLSRMSQIDLPERFSPRRRVLAGHPLDGSGSADGHVFATSAGPERIVGGPEEGYR